MNDSTKKDYESINKIIEELNEPFLSNDEALMLANKLPRYTSADPSVHETKALIERLRPHIQHGTTEAASNSNSPMPRFSEIMEAREHAVSPVWFRIQQYLLPQTQLLAWPFWIVSALVVLFGNMVYVVYGDDLASMAAQYNWHTHPLILLIPLLTGLSLCYSFRSYGTPMYELELSFPITPAQWLISRLAIIVFYDILLATAASIIFYSMGPSSGFVSYSLLPFIVSWLVPLCLYCAGSVACMLRFGVLLGSFIMAAGWFIQMLMMKQLGVFYFISDPSYGQWAESKWIALLFTLVFASDVIIYVRKQSGSRLQQSRIGR
jgi:hypothetical protein